MTRKATIGMAILLLLAVVSGISVASAADVCRDLPSGTQAAGTTIPVSLVVTLGGADTYLIEDTVPSGWEITSAPGGTISTDKSKVTYFAMGTGSDGTLTYQVAIPGGATPGSYCFTGLFGIGTGSMGPITCGDMCVTVGAIPPAADVCRDLPSGTQAAGTTIPVSLVVTLGGADTYLITDTVPSGWEITSAPGGSISTDKSSVTYSALGTGVDTTLTYQVAIPGSTAAGSYCFTGQFGIGTGSMGPITCGDMCVTVGATPPAADVCRDLPSGTQAAGTTIPVSLVVTLGGADTYLITDTVPSGWEITSAPGGSISTDKSSVTYSALGTGVDTTLTYQVAIPGSTAAGSYCFTGSFGIGTGSMGPITCGDMCVTVGAPSAADVCRDLPSGLQIAGTTIPVSLVVTLGGADTYLITDTVPSGWEITSAPGGSISTDKSSVTYSALGTGVDTTLTYQVAIPGSTAAGSYCFTGSFGIGTGSMGPITCGDMCVTVGVPDVDPQPDITSPTPGTISDTVTVSAVDLSSEGDIASCLFTYIGTGALPSGTIGYGTEAAGVWSCNWDTTTVPDGGNYNIRATMTDAAAQTGTDEIAVYVYNPCTCDFCLELDEGLNFVSVPKTIVGSPRDAVDVFNLSLISGEFCLYYDACACPGDEWNYNYDVDVLQCQGYWVNKSKEDMICLDFDVTAGGREQDLCEGWNMIGHIDETGMPIYDGTDADFGSLAGLEEPDDVKLYRSLCQWTQADGWKSYPAGDLTHVTPGRGYWVLMKQDATMYGQP